MGECGSTTLVSFSTSAGLNGGVSTPFASFVLLATPPVPLFFDFACLLIPPWPASLILHA